MSDQKEDKKIEKEEHRDERIEQTGQATLDESGKLGDIHLISIIGEIEGHENLSNNSKTTKYEHVLPQLAALEDDRKIEGILILVIPANPSLFLAVKSNMPGALPLIWNITIPCLLLLTLLIPCRSALTSAWQMG